jgi:hypothetical protein
MRTLVLLLLTAATLPAAGWQVLFDGRSASNFLSINGQPVQSTSWAVKDGCLCAQPFTGARQDLRTTNEYEAFEFEWEWRTPPKGNSGVKYLIERVEDWPHPSGQGRQARARGREYQLGDDSIFPQKERQAAALYGQIPASKVVTRPVGEWNQSKIVVKPTGEVEHWLNGERVVEYKAELRLSPVSLQNHNTEVCFRKIRIRTLQ